MNRTSTSYLCTLDVNSASDMADLALIRKTVRISNKIIKSRTLMNNVHIQQRVVVRGRKPVIKMKVNGMYTRSKGPVSYDQGGNIVGGLANATMLDVYIYDRRD